MKRPLAQVLVAMVMTVILTGPWVLAATSTPPAAAPQTELSPTLAVAEGITTITGIAISPLLGTGAYGAYRWLKADTEQERAALPWFARMKFWIPALLIVGACALKDAAGTTFPVELKKPFDVLEALENKLSGLVAAGAVVPITVDTFVNAYLGQSTAATGINPSGLAMIQIGAIDGSWFVNALAVPFGVAVFAVVWLASHAINVLILLSPWGAIDAALKAARTGVLGLIAVTSAMDPWLGACLSLLVIVVAYFLAGWAYRLTVYGTLFCWDFLTRASGRFTPRENDNLVFAGAFFKGVPVRTRGRLVQRTEGGLEFFYRPWPWLPVRKALVPLPREQLTVGRGLIFSEINSSEEKTILLLPPRYRGHEETLARAYLLAGVKPVGLRKAWSELRELFGGRAVKPQAA